MATIPSQNYISFQDYLATTKCCATALGVQYIEAMNNGADCEEELLGKNICVINLLNSIEGYIPPSSTVVGNGALASIDLNNLDLSQLVNNAQVFLKVTIDGEDTFLINELRASLSGLSLDELLFFLMNQANTNQSEYTVTYNDGVLWATSPLGDASTINGGVLSLFIENTEGTYTATFYGGHSTYVSEKECLDESQAQIIIDEINSLLSSCGCSTINYTITPYNPYLPSLVGILTLSGYALLTLTGEQILALT